MGLCVGDLEQRQMERLRGEVAETLAANFAYPPFFDFRANHLVVRPIDRAKRSEIEQFTHSVNFAPLDRIDVSSPDVRRFVERLLRRYLEVNPAFQQPRYSRLLPGMRVAAARAATQIQRSLLAHLEGKASSFGMRGQPQSWAGVQHKTILEHEETEHNTRVLEVALLRRSSDAPGPYVPPKKGTPARAASPLPYPMSGSMPGSGSSPSNWGAAYAAADATVPVTAMYPPSATPIQDAPTGPLAAVRSPSQGAHQAPLQTGPHNGRNIPEDLIQLYGDYLRDMQPEAYAPIPPQPLPPSSPAFSPAPDAARRNGYQAPNMAGLSQAHVPTVQQSGVLSEDVRSDKLIFWQLRYQLEAYIRRAARSYGVQAESGDPFGVLDALRRSGFVDEADLRIAEGILALTDKVTAGVAATVEDYRQALMLYLLYHRSHLGS